MSAPGARRTGLPRRTAALVAAAAAACAAAGACAVLAGTSGAVPPPPQPAAAGAIRPPAAPGADGRVPSGPPARGAGGSTTHPGSAPPAARPVALDIPAIGVRTRLLELGLNPDGSVQVPDSNPLEAGWFDGSPTPGSTGPAVILGHVDSYRTGPAVFYRLGALRTGDRVRVARADGSAAVFSVYAVRLYPKRGFPTLAVYGNTTGPELRLITCGDWNPAAHRYDADVVVYARLARS